MTEYSQISQTVGIEGDTGDDIMYHILVVYGLLIDTAA